MMLSRRCKYLSFLDLPGNPHPISPFNLNIPNFSIDMNSSKLLLNTSLLSQSIWHSLTMWSFSFIYFSSCLQVVHLIRNFSLLISTKNSSRINSNWLTMQVSSSTRMFANSFHRETLIAISSELCCFSFMLTMRDLPSKGYVLLTTSVCLACINAITL